MDQGQHQSWFPVWVDSLDVPVWITDPHRKLSYLNEGAEKLLGRPADECIGLPCYQVVAGTDGSGGSFCGPHCPVVSVVRDKGKLQPVRLQIAAADSRKQWIQVLVIPVTGPDRSGPWLVHCVLGSWSPWSVPFRMAGLWSGAS